MFLSKTLKRKLNAFSIFYKTNHSRSYLIQETRSATIFLLLKSNNTYYLTTFQYQPEGKQTIESPAAQKKESMKHIRQFPSVHRTPEAKKPKKNVAKKEQKQASPGKYAQEWLVEVRVVDESGVGQHLSSGLPNWS
ncbi:hypothetical protein CEXT_481731 [Caerostris extrusa]|uniref:Uncharacterized protein n=1 Tax=Caerostris extrusa TaxID=172846 RepID=A0AAV4SR93_CAEEX|nr:hypothetical protein CEXT_481731 [Caerostris extrusa]